jgi:hypothetical protein
MESILGSPELRLSNRGMVSAPTNISQSRTSLYLHSFQVRYSPSGQVYRLADGLGRVDTPKDTGWGLRRLLAFTQ